MTYPTFSNLVALLCTLMTPFCNFSSKLISEIETKMNSDLRQVCDWLKLNQLTLNIKKSQFMLIGSNSRLRRIDSIVISADGKQLKEAQCFPYLGLIINQNLTWEHHA